MEFSKIFVTRSGSFFVLILSLSTAQAAFISDLLITEVMANPLKVSDKVGEWFELFNPTSEKINLNNIFIKDNDKDSHKINNGAPLLIYPKGYLVLALMLSDIKEDEFTSVYVYDYKDFKLANGGDEIILSDGKTDLLRLDYSSRFVSSGRSSELMSKKMTEGNYQLTDPVNLNSDGDIGTPGFLSSEQKFLNTVSAPSTSMLFVFILYFLKKLKYQSIEFKKIIR